MFKIASLLMLFLLPLPVFGTGVIINEIAWMGTDTSAADEWIELYNTGSEAVDLSGWRISAADGTPDIGLSGTVGPGGFFILERTDDNTLLDITADLIYTGALSNSGEHIFLKDAGGVVIDEIDASSGWSAGDNTTKETMQRSGTSWITAPATPRAVITASTVTSPTPAAREPLLSSPSPNPPPPIPVPAISAYAGKDFIASVGSRVEFIGRAFGLKNEPLENARFWWNFGDGTSQEGRSAAHVFRSPGRYIVGLHVSSGGYAASDYLEAKIILNRVAIASVSEEAAGEIRLKNGSDTVAEIGGWILENGIGGRFIIPEKTVIGAGAEIGFSHSVTGFVSSGKPAYPFTLRFADSTKAFEFASANVQHRILNNVKVSGVQPVSPSSVPMTNISPPSSQTDEKDAPAPESLPEPPSYAAAATAEKSDINPPFLGIAAALSAAGAIGFLLIKKRYFEIT